MIFFYNYQIFPFLFRIIKHISSFPCSLVFDSCFSPRNIVSNFLQIYALIVIDSNIDVRDIAENFLKIISSKYIFSILEGFCRGILIAEVLENILAEICIHFLFSDICRFNSLIIYIISCFLF